jgi:hypothetical protein
MRTLLVLTLLAAGCSQADRQQFCKAEYDRGVIAGMEAERTATNNVDFRRTGCIDTARTERWNYLKVNATDTKKDGSVRTPWSISNAADRRLQDAIDLCLKLYPVRPS